MKHFVELKNIYKSYQNINSSESNHEVVLKNISLNIKKNEFLTILGPSGCGKSTLLKLIGGFIEPDQGEIFKEGSKITAPGLDRIMVFQKFEQLFPWENVLENVRFALKARKQDYSDSSSRELAANYINKVGLADYKDYYPKHLSGGMKQRVALARTLAAQAEVMLMDEPFGSLDSQTRRSLQSLLIKIWEEQHRTVVFVTHDLREAVFLSDRIVVMSNNPGEIKEVVTNSLTRPRNRIGNDFIDLYNRLYQIMG